MKLLRASESLKDGTDSSGLRACFVAESRRYTRLAAELRADVQNSFNRQEI